MVRGRYAANLAGRRRSATVGAARSATSESTGSVLGVGRCCRRQSGERPDVVGVPRPAQPGGLQDGVQQARGEAPDDHVGDPERRPDVAGGVPHPEPVGRVDQLGQRHPGDLRHLAGVAGGRPPAGRPTSRPPGRRGCPTGRGTAPAAWPAPARWPGRRRPPPAPRAARCRPGSPPPGPPAAGERGLPGVAAQVRGLLDEQHVGPGGALAEEDEHRGAAGGGRRRAVPVPQRQLAGMRDQPPHVLGQPGELVGGKRHSCTPRWSATSCSNSAERGDRADLHVGDRAVGGEEDGVRQGVDPDRGHHLAVPVERAREGHAASCGERRRLLAPSRLATPSTRSRSPPASASCCTSGSSSRHGPHQLAQRLTTVGTPGARLRSSVPPPKQSKTRGGQVAVARPAGRAARGRAPGRCRGSPGRCWPAWRGLASESADVQPASSASSTQERRRRTRRARLTRCPRRPGS